MKSRLNCVFNPVDHDTAILCGTSSIVVVHLRVSSCRFLFCLGVFLIINKQILVFLLLLFCVCACVCGRLFLFCYPYGSGDI